MLGALPALLRRDSMAGLKAWVADNLPRLERLTVVLAQHLGEVGAEDLHAAVTGCAGLRWVSLWVRPKVVECDHHTAGCDPACRR